jgi:hypothetical protein
VGGVELACTHSLNFFFVLFFFNCQADDLLHMQNANLHCLPENYSLKYYRMHHLSYAQVGAAENMGLNVLFCFLFHREGRAVNYES